MVLTYKYYSNFHANLFAIAVMKKTNKIKVF